MTRRSSPARRKSEGPRSQRAKRRDLPVIEAPGAPGAVSPAPAAASNVDFHSLTVEILCLANAEARVFEHHASLCRLLASTCRSDLVELWDQQSGPLLRCRRQRAGSTGEELKLVTARRTAGSTIPERPCRLILEGKAGPKGFGAALRGSGYRLLAGVPPDACQLGAQPGSRGRRPEGLTLVPFAIEGGGNRGLLVLGGALSSGAPAPELAGPPLAAALGLALAGQRARARLHERVKEMTCLYQMSTLLSDPGAPVGTVLARVAEMLGPACQYPALAAGCVVLDGRAFHSPDRHRGKHRLRADVLVGGNRRGFIEVSYPEEAPAIDGSPFLAEEQSLLQVLARQLGLFLERRQAIEERVKLEEQLRHAERLATIGTLSAGIGHELNEPIAAILGFAQLARKSAGLPLAVSEDLEKIVTGALQARNILQKLTLFARQSPPRVSPIDLNELVEEGLAFLAGRLAHDGIELVKELQPGLPKIAADASQLQQVLVNLVVNGLQAMPCGGRLTIGTELRRGKVALMVEDTGVGMTPEALHRAFLPFFTTKEVDKGTGLGLSVVHGIVKAHHGRIGVKSAPGRGARFEVLLPARTTVEAQDD